MEMSAFYVAMSRARDHLILTCTDHPAGSVDKACEFFDVVEESAQTVDVPSGSDDDLPIVHPTEPELRQVEDEGTLMFTAPSSLTAEAIATHELRDPQIFAEHPRAYSNWPPEEDKHLRHLHNLGRSTPEMARFHGRQEGAIRSRLGKLGLT